jgi:hypothetical protein
MKRILTVERLEELFAKNNNEPITTRNVSRQLRVRHDEILSLLRSHPSRFGLAIKRPVRGPGKSTIVFLLSNPPPDLQKPKPRPPIATPGIYRRWQSLLNGH